LYPPTLFRLGRIELYWGRARTVVCAGGPMVACVRVPLSCVLCTPAAERPRGSWGRKRCPAQAVQCRYRGWPGGPRRMWSVTRCSAGGSAGC